MRPIEKIILHCSATPSGVHITRDQIDKWHRKRGFAEIGYHYIIHLSGKIERGRDIDLVGAHCKGQNPKSIGVVYIGGLVGSEPVDTMTHQQEIAWVQLVSSLRTLFGKLTIHGHNEFSNKACPCFDVKTKYPFML